MYSGSCLCEAIKYKVDDALQIVVNCHCQFCRKAHGAEFVPIAILSADKLEIVQGEELLSKYEVVNVGAFRCFCSNCGTRLFNHLPARHMISLITATITSSGAIVPIANVNMESGNRNFVQTNGLPSFDTVPSIAELQEMASALKHKR